VIIELLSAFETPIRVSVAVWTFEIINFVALCVITTFRRKRRPCCHNP